MQKYEVTWLAGLIDGEGCFYFPKKEGAPRIQIAQKDPWLLLKVQHLVGGKLYKFKGNGERNKTTTYTLLMISASKAIGLMMMLYQFLSPRRQTKIVEILARWKALPLRGKCNIKTHCKRGHALTPETTFIQSNGKSRECILCSRASKLKSYHKLKLAQ